MYFPPKSIMINIRIRTSAADQSYIKKRSFMKNKAENSRTGNSRSLDQSYIWKDAAGLITKELGKSVGSERLYVNLDIIPPGAFSATYHSHSCQEEFFYILSGTGTLRLNDETYPVGPEDFSQNLQAKTSPTPSTIPAERTYTYSTSEP